MNFKRFLSIFMSIAIIFAALPLAAYAEDEAPIDATEEQITKLIDLDTLKEKVEDVFSMGSFLGYWGIYFGLAGVLGVLALPISPLLVAIHQIRKAVSDKKTAA